MDIEIPDKTYFRIGEVSKILGVEPYVVRYWETEFKTVKPIRTKSEQRLYRRKDLEDWPSSETSSTGTASPSPARKKRFRNFTGKRRRISAADEQCREKLRSIKQELKAIRDLLS